MDLRIIHKHGVLVQAGIEEAPQAPNSQQVNFGPKLKNAYFQIQNFACGYMKKHVCYGHK